MARILLSWGICSALTAFVWSANSFYGVRFLLGVAEAGFYPGVLLYVTWWFPARYRARAIGLFMLAIPVSNVVGSLVAGPLTVIYFCQNVTGYGLSLFMPQLIAKFGVAPEHVGYFTAVPYVFSGVAMLLATRYSDRTGNRAGTLATACLVSGVGLAASAMTQDPFTLMGIIIFAQMGQTSIGPTFWPLPAAILSGAGASGGLAFINSVGNLGGFFGPYAVGLIKDATDGSVTAGLLAISMATLIGAGIAVVIGHDRRAEYAAPAR